MSRMNRADSPAPQRRAVPRVRSLILCALFASLTAAGAFIRIPLPVVPFTLQYFFVALAGLLLGPVRGMTAQILFVAIGLCGFPVFANGGGPAYVFQPSFGYLLGFIAGAFVVGKCSEAMGSYSMRSVLISSVAGLATDYAIGAAYMYGILNFYLGRETGVLYVLWTGAAVFLPKDLALCVLTAFVCQNLVPALRKSGLI